MTGLTLIQARLGSTRFPRKILADLGGRPVLQWVVERARSIGLPVIVACPRDDVAEIGLCLRLLERHASTFAQNVALFAPDNRHENDVLGRLADAVAWAAIGEAPRGWSSPPANRSGGFLVPINGAWREFATANAVMAALNGPPDYILRITADSPLIDPALGRALITSYELHASLSGIRADYLSPCYPPPSCADGGLDIEVLSTEALRAANREAFDPPDREHATRFIWSQPHRFICLRQDDPHGYGSLGIRWMVDTPEDLARLNRLVEHLPVWATGWRATRAAQADAEAAFL